MDATAATLPTEEVALSPADAKFFAALATALSRAETLIEDGYRVVPVPGFPFQFRVFRPAATIAKDGGPSSYRVTLSEDAGEWGQCDCPFFEQTISRGIFACKHCVGVDLHVAAALDIVRDRLTDVLGGMVDADALETKAFDEAAILCVGILSPRLLTPGMVEASRRRVQDRLISARARENAERRAKEEITRPVTLATPLYALPPRGSVAYDRQRDADFG